MSEILKALGNISSLLTFAGLLAAFSIGIFREEEYYRFVSSFTRKVYSLAEGLMPFLTWASIISMLFYIWFSSYDFLFYFALLVITAASLIAFLAISSAIVEFYIPPLRRRMINRRYRAGYEQDVRK